MEYQILHNEEKHRFETTIDGRVAKLEYRMGEDRMREYYHTGVPEELEGKGVGSALVKYALDYARENNWRVKPVCPFVRIYIERHPEYKDI